MGIRCAITFKKAIPDIWHGCYGVKDFSYKHPKGRNISYMVKTHIASAAIGADDLHGHTVSLAKGNEQHHKPAATGVACSQPGLLAYPEPGIRLICRIEDLAISYQIALAAFHRFHLYL